MNLLAPAHDINHRKGSLLRRGSLLLLMRDAPQHDGLFFESHHHLVLKGLPVVPMPPPRVPPTRVGARGETLHTFESTRT